MKQRALYLDCCNQSGYHIAHFRTSSETTGPLPHYASPCPTPGPPGGNLCSFKALDITKDLAEK